MEMNLLSQKTCTVHWAFLMKRVAEELIIFERAVNNSITLVLNCYTSCGVPACSHVVHTTAYYQMVVVLGDVDIMMKERFVVITFKSMIILFLKFQNNDGKADNCVKLFIIFH